MIKSFSLRFTMLIWTYACVSGYSKQLIEMQTIGFYWTEVIVSVATLVSNMNSELHSSTHQHTQLVERI